MTTTTTRRLAAAGPAWVGERLAGEPRAATVVHRGADAVYLEVAGRCLGVLSSTATAVPCALQTGLDRLPPALVTAERAVVGAGRVLLAGTEVVHARTVDCTVPVLPLDAAAPDRLAGTAGDRLDAVRAELPPEALATLVAGRAEAVPLLLGRGSGLTPVGDDVLAGWLATTTAARRGPGIRNAVAEAATAQAPARTTLLSATLLECAARGEVLPQFRRLLVTLADPRPRPFDPPGPLARAVNALLGVGHTSGAGLTLGCLLALRQLATRSPA
jgi:hypothetical protein